MALWIFHILIIGIASFVAYVILIAVDRKQLAQLTIMVAVMMGLLSTIQDLSPVVEGWLTKIEGIQSSLDKVGLGSGNWEIPMKGEITQGYNEHNHGLDIAGEVGEAVKATRKGDVSKIAYDDIYGNYIIINHGGGMESLYGHLSGLNTKVGYPIIAGQKIGCCGTTGNSTGPHLHFEIRKSGKAVDPAIYLD